MGTTYKPDVKNKTVKQAQCDLTQTRKDIRRLKGTMIKYKITHEIELVDPKMKDVTAAQKEVRRILRDNEAKGIKTLVVVICASHGGMANG